MNAKSPTITAPSVPPNVTMDRPGTYLVATAEPPAIVCPPWCTVPPAEHVAELENWEGMVVHHSGDRVLSPGFTASIGASATPGGDPDPTDPPCLHLQTCPAEIRPADAVVAGAALLALAREAMA